MVNTNYRNLEVLRFITNKSGLSQLTLTTDNSATPIINYGDNTGVHSTIFSKNYPDNVFKTVSIFSNQINKISGITINATNPVQIYNELDLTKLSRLCILNFNGGINPKLHRIIFRNSIDNAANTVTNFSINTTAINGLIDYSGQFNIAGTLGLNNNPNLNFVNSPIKKTNGNVVSNITFSGSSTPQNLLGNLDLSLYDYITGSITTNGNPNLYNVILPSVTNSLNNGSHIIADNTFSPKSKLGGVLDISSLLEFGQIETTDSNIRNIWFPNNTKKTSGISNLNFANNNLLGLVDMSGIRYYDNITFSSYNLNYLFFNRQSVVSSIFNLNLDNNIQGTLDLDGLIGTSIFSSATNNNGFLLFNCNNIILPSTTLTSFQLCSIGPNTTSTTVTRITGVLDLSGMLNLGGDSGGTITTIHNTINTAPKINNILLPNKTISLKQQDSLLFINSINFKGVLDISGLKNIQAIRLFDFLGDRGSNNYRYSQLHFIQYPLNYSKLTYTVGLADTMYYNALGVIDISNLIDSSSTIYDIGNINLYTLIYPQQGVITTVDNYINIYIKHVVDLSCLKNFTNIVADSIKSNIILPNNHSANTSTTGSLFFGAKSGAIPGITTGQMIGLYKNSELTGLLDLSGIAKLNGSNIYLIAGHTTVITAYTPASGGVVSTNPLIISTISLRTAPKLNFLNNPLTTKTTSFGTTDNYYVFSGGLQGTLDLTNFIYLGSGGTTIANAFHVIDCPNLNTIIFHSNITKSRYFSHFQITNNGLVGVFDIRQITNLGGSIQISNNPYISEILFPTSYISGVNNITLLNITLTNITSLDLSNMQHIGKTINISNNSSLTSVTFPGTMTGTAVDYLALNNNNLTGTLNISIFTNQATTSRFECANNVNLTNLTLPTANITNFVASICNLNITFPFGTTIKKLLDIQIQNNIMSNANVDATIDNIFNNRGAGNVDTTTFNNTVTKTLNISGSNSAPTGTYTMPLTGYVGIIHDKTDAEITTASAGQSINEKVQVLVNLKISNVSSILRYKQSITTT